LSKPKLLLIGWDAADWKIINPLIERGEMPTLERFLDGGVMGDMTTLEPILSPMLWNSIGTGKRADKHGILGFTEVDPDSGSVRPVTSTSRKAKALWNILSQRGFRSNVVSWFGGHPAEPINGAVVSDAFTRGFAGDQLAWPLITHTIHPPRLAAKMAELRVRPDEINEEIILTFVPRAREVDQATDPRLGLLMKFIAECFSTHAAATWLMQNEPWDFTAIYYSAIDHLSHVFMRFHPPRRRGVDEKSFQIFHDVVNGAYRLHDLMLRTLLALAGDDTTVILLSDHGFHSDHLRPKFIAKIPTGAAIEHRPLGILAMRGPGLKQDERIYGANLLDIAPTVLTLLGLPVGRDMDGRVLVEAFGSAPDIQVIDSWETEAGDAGMHTGNIKIESDDARAMLEQFVALGYVDAPTADKEQAARNCRSEQQWNLARVFLEAQRYLEALPLLEQLHEELPERPDVALALARTLLRIGLWNEAEETLRLALQNARDTPATHWLFGEIAFHRGDYNESLNHLLTAKKAQPRAPELLALIGQTLLRLKKWVEADESFRRALKADPHHAISHLGLAVALLRRGKNLEAAEAALDAVSYAHPLPLGHFHLGIALARMREDRSAARALETAVRLDNALPAAHRALARIYLRLGEKEKADSHRQKLEETENKRERKRKELAQFRRQAAKRSRARRARVAALREAKVKARTDLATGEEAAEKVWAEEQKAPRLDLVVVSGLPRSGTSLMMQMLAAGGLPIMSDRERQADADNPEGYHEWEEIKKLPQRPEILRQADGKAVKIISALLPDLPRRHRYRIIFMDRPLEEVTASQQKMIARRGTHAPDSSRMREILEAHRTDMLGLLASSPNVSLLRIPFGGLIAKPEPFIALITEFIGAASLPHPERMRDVIKPHLHRNREAMAIS